MADTIAGITMPLSRSIASAGAQSLGDPAPVQLVEQVPPPPPPVAGIASEGIAEDRVGAGGGVQSDRRRRSAPR